MPATGSSGPNKRPYSESFRQTITIFDDFESGWNGRYILSFDPEEHYNWEVRAYNVEMEIAKSMGREDMVERLESLLERERKAIFNEE